MNYMEHVAQLLGVKLYEKFKICNSDRIFMLTNETVEANSGEDDEWTTNSRVLNKLLNGEYQISRPILTEKEKEYLSAVVKPFRDEVKHISKNQYDDEEWIQIRTKQGLALLPPFKEGLMYKGMKVDKEYSVKELDI